MKQKTPIFSLTSNQLKLIAIVAMTIDHIGLNFFPQYAIFRILGRLAFPIFAFMIAEGCRHTKHPLRYFFTVLCLGIVCELLSFAIRHTFYKCILFTFALSILLCFSLQIARNRAKWYWGGFFLACLVSLAAYRWLPQFIDYGIAGVLIPLLIYSAATPSDRLLAAGIGLTLKAAMSGGVQWYSLLALLPLSLYRGERGSAKLKYLFYIYYPVHLAVLWFIAVYLMR